ncbi:hypothetical protein PR048_032480 [Dryococelus australis]|uniref:FLYWCH-type domain-containing protein n=1 Tax=Dryococelus australis TaxID=614101 RepID=A0ABQ9G2B1_9NEOP|nr:hypothetical protein PR048_032480 [Dryococelus australis]
MLAESRVVAGEAYVFPVDSSRGGIQLALENYLFSRNRQQNGRSFWRCIEYHRSRCSARCTTVDTTVVATSGEHNHEPHKDKISFLKTRVFMESLSHSRASPSW